MNQITIHGNVGADPELRYTPSQMPVAEFRVADKYGKDDKEKTTWHNIVVFGPLAENLCNTISKGDTVIVVGRYETDEYTKKDGTPGKSIKVIANEIGVSVRWNRWVKDKTDQVMAKVGKSFPKPQAMFEDDDAF